MLVRGPLDQLSMNDLARAADVSRGTLYRIFPGKSALMEGLIDAYSPYEAVRAIVTQHRADPPRVVLPLIARAVLGVAGERLGLMRAVFSEASSGSQEVIAGMRPAFGSTVGLLGEYMVEQMALGRLRSMHPLLAIQVFIGPIAFHLLTRATIEGVASLPIPPDQAVDILVETCIAGLEP
jgi:AcrR family transcriptional regulator